MPVNLRFLSTKIIAADLLKNRPGEGKIFLVYVFSQFIGFFVKNFHFNDY